MEPSVEQLLERAGDLVRDRDDRRIGVLTVLYTGAADGSGVWLGVRTARFSKRLTLVPWRGARPDARGVRVAWSRGHVHGAPQVAPDRPVSAQHERTLCRHYGIEPTDGARRAAWERRSLLVALPAPAATEPAAKERRAQSRR